MPHALSANALGVPVLSLLLARHPARVHTTEITRGFDREDWPSSLTAPAVDGLLHRHGDMLHASRVAVCAEQLAL